MNIRIDEGIAPLELALAAAHIGARVELRGGEYVMRRPAGPDHRVPLAHYSNLLEQARAEAGVEA